MGSNPTIYRIKTRFKLINQTPNINANTIVKTIIIYKYLSVFWTDKLSIYWQKTHNKLNITKVYKHTGQLSLVNNNVTLKKKLSNQLFNSYLTISANMYTSVCKLHSSFKSFFIKQSSKGSSIINLVKFFNNWLSMSSHLYDTLTYKIKPMFFGTTFFKKEIYTLNWLSLATTDTNLRLSKVLFFITPIDRTVTSDKIIKLITLKGVTNALVFDTQYHKTTLDYLHKFTVFTLGAVPVTYDAKVVDFAIPISSDNIFTQLFILKLVNKFSKNIEYNEYFNHGDVSI